MIDLAKPTRKDSRITRHKCQDLEHTRKITMYRRNNIQKNHAPAAVILSRVVDKVKDEIPGPGAYQPNYKKLIKVESGFKIGHSEKIGDIVGVHKKLPGPGQYETTKSTLSSTEHAYQFGSDKRS